MIPEGYVVQCHLRIPGDPDEYVRFCSDESDVGPTILEVLGLAHEKGWADPSVTVTFERAKTKRGPGHSTRRLSRRCTICLGPFLSEEAVPGRRGVGMAHAGCLDMDARVEQP